MKGILAISVAVEGVSAIANGTQVPARTPPQGVTSITVTNAVASRALIDLYFKPPGRYDLQARDTCSYAYLESPSVMFDRGDVVFRAHFATRQGAEVMGNCVGASDTCEVTARARVRASEGAILLDNLRMTQQGGTTVSELVLAGLRGLLPESYSVDVDEVLQALESSAPSGYKDLVGAFDLSDLSAVEGRLVLRGKRRPPASSPVSPRLQ